MTMTSTSTHADVAVVRGGFAAVAAGDLAAFAAAFHSRRDVETTATRTASAAS
jgi:hypothetical protein